MLSRKGSGTGIWREQGGGPVWREEVDEIGALASPYQPIYEASIGPHQDEQAANAGPAYILVPEPPKTFRCVS